MAEPKERLTNETGEAEDRSPDPPPGGAPYDGVVPGDTPAPSALEEIPAPTFPWPPPPGVSALDGLIETIRGSMFYPSAFFRAMPPDDRVGPAVLYYLIIGLVAAALQLFWSTLFRAIGMGDSVLDSFGSFAERAGPVIEFLLSPLLLLFTLLLGTVSVHATLAVIAGARFGPGTTARALCYASSPSLLYIVPFLGPFIAAFWSVVVLIVGLREAHRTDLWRGVVAVAVPFAFLIGALAVLVLAAALLAPLLGGDG